ncbi:MAG TPA: carbohydrate kinase, partial [Candidatus Sutterella merdavium]|nr:carbohydrate kinase [Candidatus Sutterella merdavium]
EGGSRDALWNQIKSDMLEATVVRYRNAGGAVLTNALFGAWATSERAGDVSAVVELLSKAIEEDAQYEPDPETASLYDRIGTMRTKLIREDMREAFRNLVAIRNL